MGLLDVIASIFGGGFLGTVFGGLFALVGQWFKLKEQKQNLDHNLAMRREDKEYMMAEAEMGLRRISLEQEGQTERSLLKAREAAYKYDKRTFSNGVLESWKPTTKIGHFFRSYSLFMLVQVDIARGLTRPAMTWFSAVVAFWLGATIFASFGQISDLSQAHRFQLVMQLIQFAFSLVGMAWSFWFVDRSAERMQIGANGSRSFSRGLPPVDGGGIATGGKTDAESILTGNAGAVDDLVGGLRK